MPKAKQLTSSDAPEETTPTAPEPKAVRYRGMESRLHLSRSVENVWTYLVERNVPYEALLSPDYWAAFAQKFQPYDELKVRAEDGSYKAWFLVIDVGLNWVKVVPEREPLFLFDRPGDRAVSLDGHSIVWNSVEKWSVIRDIDRAKIMAGFQTRDAAMVWLSGHLKAMAA